MKKFLKQMLVILLCLSLFCNPDIIGLALVDDNSRSELIENIPDGCDLDILAAYEELCSNISLYDIPSSISFEVFANEYAGGEYQSIDDYLNLIYSYFGTMNVGTNSATTYTLSTSNWYYNTGRNLTANPDYSRYNLLTMVQPGDIIFEAAGGSGITGHISIVEGIYYDSHYGRYYIGIIEAIGYISGSGQADGVCRGVLDDDRLDNRQGTILRVASATSNQISGAIDFCVNQIGDDYNIDLCKDTQDFETDWYCSELVWAAYMSQGIDLDTVATSTVVWPDDILNSSETSVVPISSINIPQNVRVTASESNYVNISWSPVNGATKYYIFSSDSISGSYSLLTSVTSTSYSYYLTEDSLVFYRIRAYVDQEASNLSDPVGIKNDFTAPQIRNIYTPSSTSVKIIWNSVQNATSYKVFRSKGNNSNYSLIATTSVPTYTDTTCTTGIMYYYKVSAVNGSQETATSEYHTIKPTKVLTPQIYFGIYKGDYGVEVKWTHIPGATSYSVYMATNQYTNNFVCVYETGKTTCSFVPSSYSTMYVFKIVAYGNGGNSEYSGSLYLPT